MTFEELETAVAGQAAGRSMSVMVEARTPDISRTFGVAPAVRRVEWTVFVGRYLFEGETADSVFALVRAHFETPVVASPAPIGAVAP
jgi:hypothetical protein